VVSGNALYGVLGGIASHHFLDAMPHFDQGTFALKREGPRYLGYIPEYAERNFGKREWIILFFDWAISAFIFLMLAAFLPLEHLSWAVSGAVGGVLPDVLDSSPLWSRQLRKKFKLLAIYHQFHSFFHWTVSMRRLWLGVLTQFVFIGASLAIIFGMHLPNAKNILDFIGL
jgi:hypothetical protein